jgi:hypothetical protein
MRVSSAKINISIGVFHPALWRRNGRNMRGLIWRMNLVTMEEQRRFAEVEKVKTRVQYDLLGLRLEVKMENSP